MGTEAVTIVIAVIGCVTGVTAIVLQTLEYLHNRPKITLEKYCENLNGFHLNDDYAHFRCEHIVLVHFKIINLRQNSVSIKSVVLDSNGLKLKPSHDYKLDEISFPEQGKSYRPIDATENLSIPRLIEPMEVINVRLIFVFADALYDKYLQQYGKPLSVKLSIQFSHVTVVQNIALSKLTPESIHSSYQLECQSNQEYKEIQYH